MAAYQAISVGTVAVQLAAANTSTVAIANNGTASIYLGTDASVTTASGFPLAAGAQISFSITAMFSIYAISTATQDVRVLLGLA